jgi:hypothetical protein
MQFLQNLGNMHNFQPRQMEPHKVRGNAARRAPGSAAKNGRAAKSPQIG